METRYKPSFLLTTEKTLENNKQTTSNSINNNFTQNQNNEDVFTYSAHKLKNKFYNIKTNNKILKTFSDKEKISVILRNPSKSQRFSRGVAISKIQSKFYYFSQRNKRKQVKRHKRFGFGLFFIQKRFKYKINFLRKEGKQFLQNFSKFTQK